MSRSRQETDFQRAVIEHAVIWGWHVPAVAGRRMTKQGTPRSTDPLPGLAFHPPVMIGSEIGWPDLTLVRRRDRRLVFAELTMDTGRLSLRKRLVLDLLRSLEWNGAADEQQRSERALGHSAPCIQTFVWRPADLVAGTIDEVLR